MNIMVWLALVGLTLANLSGPVLARPTDRPGRDPGVNNRTPVATYVKWEALTSIQQEALVKAWGINAAEAAVKWNALEAADQRDALIKYAKLKVVSPRR